MNSLDVSVVFNKMISNTKSSIMVLDVAIIRGLLIDKIGQ